MTGQSQIRIHHVPREKDELVLSWVRRRAGGTSASRIANEEGINSGIVIIATNAVRNADVRESGEVVDGHYW